MKGKPKKDLLQGTLDLLILRILSSGALHGYGIARRIEVISEDVLKVQQGSLYPALHRLEDRALIRSKWEVQDGKRPMKVYTLSAAGRRALQDETETWESYANAINTILRKA